MGSVLEPGSFWNLLLIAVGFGAGGEATRRYARFKARRRAMPLAERNRGFWTDRHIYEAEGVFAALAMAVPFTAIVWAISTNQRIELVYVALVAYALAIYLLMLGLNRHTSQ